MGRLKVFLFYHLKQEKGKQMASVTCFDNYLPQAVAHDQYTSYSVNSGACKWELQSRRMGESGEISYTLLADEKTPCLDLRDAFALLGSVFKANPVESRSVKSLTIAPRKGVAFFATYVEPALKSWNAFFQVFPALESLSIQVEAPIAPIYTEFLQEIPRGQLKELRLRSMWFTKDDLKALQAQTHLEVFEVGMQALGSDSTIPTGADLLEFCRAAPRLQVLSIKGGSFSGILGLNQKVREAIKEACPNLQTFEVASLL